jgi:hypothetical protein
MMIVAGQGLERLDADVAEPTRPQWPAPSSWSLAHLAITN